MSETARTTYERAPRASVAARPADAQRAFAAAHHTPRLSAPGLAYLLLRFGIKSNRIPRGTRFDDRSAMADLGMSRATVRHALNQLRGDDLLSRARRTGTEVTADAFPVALATAYPSDDGGTVGTLPLTTRRMPAGSALSERFGADAPALLVTTRAIVSAGERIGTMDVVVRDDGAGVGVGDGARVVPDAGSRAAGRVDIAVDAIRADADSAADLGVQAGDPLLAQERSVHDAGGALVEYSVAVYRADRATFVASMSS